MATTVRATYSGGVLKPTAPLDLREGEQVTLSIESAEPATEGHESLLEMFDRLRNSVTPARRHADLAATTSQPTDAGREQEALPVRIPEGIRLMRTLFADRAAVGLRPSGLTRIAVVSEASQKLSLTAATLRLPLSITSPQ